MSTVHCCCLSHRKYSLSSELYPFLAALPDPGAAGGEEGTCKSPVKSLTACHAPGDLRASKAGREQPPSSNNELQESHRRKNTGHRKAVVLGPWRPLSGNTSAAACSDTRLGVTALTLQRLEVETRTVTSGEANPDPPLLPWLFLPLRKGHPQRGSSTTDQQAAGGLLGPLPRLPNFLYLSLAGVFHCTNPSHQGQKFQLSHGINLTGEEKEDSIRV